MGKRSMLVAVALVGVGAASCSLFKSDTATINTPSPSLSASPVTQTATPSPTPSAATAVTPTPTHRATATPSPTKAASPAATVTPHPVVTATASPGEITAASGSTQAIKVGAQESLKILADPNTAWQVTTSPNSAILKLVSATSGSRPGTTQVQYTYVFQGVAAGTTTFTISEVAAVAGGPSPGNISYTLTFSVS